MRHQNGIINKRLDTFAYVEFGRFLDIVGEFIFKEVLEKSIVDMQVGRYELEGVALEDGQRRECRRYKAGHTVVFIIL